VAGVAIRLSGDDFLQNRLQWGAAANGAPTTLREAVPRAAHRTVRWFWIATRTSLPPRRPETCPPPRLRLGSAPG